MSKLPVDHRMLSTLYTAFRCGLMYASETGRSLQSRINGPRAGIIKDGESLLYKHFGLPGHSVADMKVQIFE